MSDGQRPNTVRVWAVSLAVFLVATGALYSVRSSLQQAHVVLVYLLIVLAAAAYGGRALGFTMAVLEFFVIDYFFQIPFDRFTVGNPVDWFVLVAFLLTATIAASLLARAQEAAERAEHRTVEVSQLSKLGAELLGAGTAEHALAAIAAKVRDGTGAEACIVFRAKDPSDPGDLDPLVVLGDAGSVDARRAATVARTGTVFADHDAGPPTHSLIVPLRVHDRTVGVLAVASSAALARDDAARRLFDALTYYAALAVERVTLVAQLERAEAVRESARVREALLASVSHDLRTPLSTIKVLAQDLLRRCDPATAARNGSIIEEQADRLTGMVSNLLDLTRLRSSALPVNLEVNAADDMIGAVARQVSGILADHRLEREIDQSGPVLLGRFDFVQSQRILVNLIENAVRYSPVETTITLRAWRDADWLKFSVADRGPGIAPDERERIFEPFYRGPTATADSGGVGLGLYISRALADAQSGRLDLITSPGGSTFVLALPAVDASDFDADGDALESAEAADDGRHRAMPDY